MATPTVYRVILGFNGLNLEAQGEELIEFFGADIAGGPIPFEYPSDPTMVRSAAIAAVRAYCAENNLAEPADSQIIIIAAV